MFWENEHVAGTLEPLLSLALKGAASECVLNGRPQRLREACRAAPLITKALCVPLLTSSDGKCGCRGDREQRLLWAIGAGCLAPGVL